MKVLIGWDQRDIKAYLVCVHSLIEHASIDLEIIPIRDYQVRAQGIYWRGYHVCGKHGRYSSGQMVDDKDDKPFSTGFSFTRFLTPALCGFDDEWVLFLDADMLWRDDIANMISVCDTNHSVFCVKHDHRPPEEKKMDGVAQTRYARKNWSSVMLMNPSKCDSLDAYSVNNMPGSWLHSFCWVEDDQIGGLDERWNFLCGHSNPADFGEDGPSIVHFTRGDPSMGWVEEPYADEWEDALARADPALLLEDVITVPSP
jgi:lipopolysaccharide biosynthesis glycosyltransferase